MKKFLSVLMVIAMFLSLGISSYATENTGSITVTNATVGYTYNLYKFFDASYAHDEDGNIKYDKNGNAIVSYTIDTENQFFDDLFGVDGTAENAYFIYYPSTGAVSRKEDALDRDIISYLDGIANKTGTIADRSILAQQTTVVFDNIPTGYYLVDRGLSSIVTITSNLPNVQIIDKNQKPGDFSKLVFDEDYVKDGQVVGEWVKSSSANIGDMIKWKLDFVATNYDGDEEILYYTIRDTKSSSLWVEFDSIKIKIGDDYLGKGYYWCAGDDLIDTDDWEAEDNPEQWTDDPAQASWYLIHYGLDDFEIVIPWANNYTFTGIGNNTIKGYELSFDLDANDGNNIISKSEHDSPSYVTVTYSASVGPDAVNTVSRNSATLDWITPEGTFGPEDPEVTETRVYNMGITKTANDHTSTTAATRLAGAIFELFSDIDCEHPVYVIPTNNDGVYILDDSIIDVSGLNRTTARMLYADHLDENYVDAEDNPIYRNTVETPANGQVVILGLEAGTYYLREFKAPSGYNKLGGVIEVTVGSGITAVYNNEYTDINDNPVTYTVYSVTVINNSGSPLPSTGGAGTVWMITIGTLLAIGFAIFLITHKKMSVYND